MMGERPFDGEPDIECPDRDRNRDGDRDGDRDHYLDRNFFFHSHEWIHGLGYVSWGLMWSDGLADTWVPKVEPKVGPPRIKNSQSHRLEMTIASFSKDQTGFDLATPNSIIVTVTVTVIRVVQKGKKL